MGVWEHSAKSLQDRRDELDTALSSQCSAKLTISGRQHSPVFSSLTGLAKKIVSAILECTVGAQQLRYFSPPK